MTPFGGTKKKKYQLTAITRFFLLVKPNLLAASLNVNFNPPRKFQWLEGAYLAYFQRRLLLVSGSASIVTHHHVRHQVITSSPFTSPTLSLHSTGKPWNNLEEANEEKAIMGEYLVPRAKRETAKTQRYVVQVELQRWKRYPVDKKHAKESHIFARVSYIYILCTCFYKYQPVQDFSQQIWLDLFEIDLG